MSEPTSVQPRRELRAIVADLLTYGPLVCNSPPEDTVDALFAELAEAVGLQPLVEPTVGQRRNWFETLCREYPGHVKHHDDEKYVDSNSFGSGELLGVDDIERFLVVEYAPGWNERNLYLAADKAALERLVTDLIDNHENGDDYGWRVQDITDLSDNQSLSFKPRVRIDYGRGHAW
jgi:hypothetical protein